MKEPTNTPHADREEQVREAISELAERTEILFEHPNLNPKTPGRSLSPKEMIAATHEPRADQTQDPLLWLTETPLVAVDKDGIDLLRRTYTGLDMMPLTTGRKGQPRRDLVMRYNRAELARGVLKEIVVLQRDSQGVYEELGCAVRSDVFRQDTDYSVVLRERAKYVEEAMKKVTLHREDYVRLERGTDALEDLVSAVQARKRFQRRSRPEPVVCSPRFANSEGSHAESQADYDEMMENRPQAADEDSSTEGSLEHRVADIITGSEGDGDDPDDPSAHGASSKAGKNSSGSSSPTASPESGKDGDLGNPLAGGSAGLVDLLETAPIEDTEDDETSDGEVTNDG
jgi:hypothetical protein